MTEDDISRMMRDSYIPENYIRKDFALRTLYHVKGGELQDYLDNVGKREHFQPTLLNIVGNSNAASDLYYLTCRACVLQMRVGTCFDMMMMDDLVNIRALPKEIIPANARFFGVTGLTEDDGRDESAYPRYTMKRIEDLILRQFYNKALIILRTDVPVITSQALSPYFRNCITSKSSKCIVA